jgi:hypothetical protein
MSAGTTVNILWHVNLLANGREIGNHTTAVTNKHVSTAREYSNNGSGVFYVVVRELLQLSHCELLLLEPVAEARDISGTQRKGNIHHWKLLPSNGSEDMTVDTGVCMRACVRVTVICKV